MDDLEAREILAKMRRRHDHYASVNELPSPSVKFKDWDTNHVARLSGMAAAVSCNGRCAGPDEIEYLGAIIESFCRSILVERCLASEDTADG